jgi:hypothetical protein
MENKYILIKEIAEDFVFQTYNNEIPDGYCFSLCYPLSILFSLMEIEHEITIGKSRKNNIEVSHFWITFDNNGIILDPTIKHFNQNESSVYLGDIQKNETTNRYVKIENKGDEIFPNIYELWANLLYQHKHRIPLPIDLEKKLITLNVAASQVLFYYINKLGLKEMLLKSKYGLSYFKPISFVCNQHNLVDEILICLNQPSLKYKDEIIELGKIA